MRKNIAKIKVDSRKRLYRRRLSIRKKVEGTSERPRICVNKSNKNIFVQVINDEQSKTLFSVQTFGKNAVKGASCNVEGAKVLGKTLAEKLKGEKLEAAVFDRGGLRYTGVLAALVESTRENGIRI